MKNKIRYTHWITLYIKDNNIFDGTFDDIMVPSSTQPDEPFYLAMTASAFSGLKITGLVDGVSTTENFSLEANDLTYSNNMYDSITNIESYSYKAGDTINITSVNDNYQTLDWTTTYGPYRCVFSTLGGMSAGLQQTSEGLKSVITRYCRVPWEVPVSKDMEFMITPGFEDELYVPSTDFNRVCIPGKYIPIEWEFYAQRKSDL